MKNRPSRVKTASGEPCGSAEACADAPVPPPSGAGFAFRSLCLRSIHVSAAKICRIQAISPLKSLNNRFRFTTAPVHCACRRSLTAPR